MNSKTYNTIELWVYEVMVEGRWGRGGGKSEGGKKRGRGEGKEPGWRGCN